MAGLLNLILCQLLVITQKYFPQSYDGLVICYQYPQGANGTRNMEQCSVGGYRHRI